MKAVELVPTQSTVACQENDTVHQALTLMKRRNMPAIPVVDRDGYGCGLLVAQDAMRELAQKGLDAKRVLVSQVMPQDTVMCQGKDSLQDVLCRLQELDTDWALVMQKNDCLGLLSKQVVLKTMQIEKTPYRVFATVSNF